MLRILSGFWLIPLLLGLPAGSSLLGFQSRPPVGVEAGSLPLFYSASPVSSASPLSDPDAPASSPMEEEDVSQSPQATMEIPDEVREWSSTIFVSLLIIAGFVALIAGILVTRSH